LWLIRIVVFDALAYLSRLIAAQLLHLSRHFIWRVAASVDAVPEVFSGGPFMGKKLYVGNLAYGVTDSQLEQLFSAHGAVQSAQVIMDRDTGRSKGFGFVEMSNSAEAESAISALNGVEKDGRAMTVNEARPKAEGGGGGGGGGRGRSDYGGGGGGGGRRY
jgi:cold-inducible RNA-binding protein